MKRSLFNLLGSMVVLSLVGQGCGDNEPNNPSTTGDGDSSTDTSGDGDGTGGGTSTTGDGDPTCTSSQTDCDGVCTNTNSDPDNCGACGDSCESGEGCSGGECVRFGCAPGQVECSDACVNLQRDPEHCGECESPCADGEACSAGACVTSCPDGQLACNGTCIDPSRDTEFCGATECFDNSGGGGAGGGTATSDGETCGGGELCVEGACVTSCSPSQVVCGDECVDPRKDRNFCGATTCEDGATSGEACASGEVCVAGSCTASCPSNQLECDGKCVDPLGDRNYCGASDCESAEGRGEACAGEESCVIGECRAFVPAWSLGERVDVVDEHNVYYYQRIDANAAGQAVAVWRQATQDDPDVDTEFLSNRLYASVYDPGTKMWSPQVRISPAEVDIRTVDVDIAADGTALAVWIEGGLIKAPAGEDPGNEAMVSNRLFASHFDGTSWSTPTRVDDGSDDGDIDTKDLIDSPRLAIDSDGDGYLVWAEGDRANGWATSTIYGRRWSKDAAAFDDTIHQFARGTSIDPNKPVNAVSPRIAINSFGKAVVAVIETVRGGPGPLRNTTVAYVSDISTVSDPVWSAPVDVQASTQKSVLRDAIDVGIDEAGNAHLAYAAGGRYSRNLYLDYFDASGSSWSSKSVTDIVGDSSGTRLVQFLDLEVQGGGDAWVAFEVDSTTGSAIVAPKYVYVQSFSGTSETWSDYEIMSAATTVDEDTSRPIPVVASDNDGNTFVSWVRHDASTFAEARRYDANRGVWSDVAQLNTSKLAVGTSPQLAVSSGGVAFSSWVQYVPDITGNHLYVARFN